MYKIKIVSVGKTKEAWLQDALLEYEKRLKNALSIDWILVKSDELLEQTLEKEDSFIGLDPNGAALTSEAFSKQLLKFLESEGSRLTFVIGGAEGLSSKIKKRAIKLLSLSPLTFTHQLTRLVLVEQLYRALEIAKGSNYHK